MLCPRCRRQVGKDGYCPEGHEARPATPPPPALQQPAYPPPLPGAPPPAIPPEPGIPAAPATSKRRPLVVAIVLVLLGAAVLRIVAFGPAASAANLRFVFTKGESHTYSLAMTFNFKALSVQYGGLSFNGAMATTLTQRTLSVDRNGGATVAYELGKIRFTEGKTSVEIPAQGEVLRARMAPDGTVKDAKGKGLLSFTGSDPMAGFVNMSGPEAFGPILPDFKVDPGETWTVDQNMSNPFGETIKFRGRATLVEKRQIDGEEVAAIHSVMEMPFNLDASFADLAEFAGEEAPAELRGVRMTFNGFFNGDLTQSLATKSGNLRSALGDIKMTGTIGFEGIPGLEHFEAVLNGAIQLTMTEVPG